MLLRKTPIAECYPEIVVPNWRWAGVCGSRFDEIEAAALQLRPRARQGRKCARF